MTLSNADRDTYGAITMLNKSFVARYYGVTQFEDIAPTWNSRKTMLSLRKISISHYSRVKTKSQMTIIALKLQRGVNL